MALPAKPDQQDGKFVIMKVYFHASACYSADRALKFHSHNSHEFCCAQLSAALPINEEKFAEFRLVEYLSHPNGRRHSTIL